MANDGVEQSSTSSSDKEVSTKWVWGTTLVVFGTLWISPDSLLIKLASCSGADTLIWRMSYFGVTISLSGYIVALWHSNWVCTDAIRSVYQAMVAMGWPFPALLVTVVYIPTITFFVLALEQTSAANCLVIVGTSPLRSAIISCAVLKEPLRLVTPYPATKC